MGKKLAGRVAIITGACGGLGLAISKAMLDEGAAVVLTDVSDKMMQEGDAALAKDYKGRYKICMLDVTSGVQTKALMSEIDKEFGRIDILVNLAGGSLFTPKKLEEIEEIHWDKVINVNLKGTFLCSQAVVPYMQKNKYGKIINVSSIGGRTASIVTGVAYAAAKGGVIAFTRRLAMEVGGSGINVNAIAPGTVLSGERMINLWNELNDAQKGEVLSSIPLGRLSTAEEQASVVVFLASDDSAYITGVVIDCNGGRLMA